MLSIKSKQRTLKIKGQLYLVYIVAIFVPVFIIGAYLFFNSYQMIWGHYVANLKSDNLRVRSIIGDTTTSITNICDDISVDAELQKILFTQYASWDMAQDDLKNYTQITNYLARYTEVSSITLYTTNPTLHDYGYIKKAPEALQSEAWFQQVNSSYKYFWTTSMVTTKLGNHVTELRLAKKIPILRTNNYAILVITVSNNYLKSRVDSNTLFVDITVNDNPIFYSNWGNREFAVDYPIDYSKPYFSFSGRSIYGTLNQLLEISTYKPIKSIDKIYIVSSDPEAIAYTQRVLIITVTIVLIGLIVPLIIISVFTKKFSSRVDTLHHEMHQVSNGNYNIIDNFKGDDELAELFHDLQTMILNIKERDREIFDEKISKQKLINHQQKMELEILSSQINPHFLYNTLETIRMKAFQVGNLEVAEATKLLGKYMRHNLESSGNRTNLKTDLEYIVIYLRIQKLRFTSRINFEISVDPDINTAEYPILPLLIQPIVENAIIHGIEQRLENGQIKIHICLEAENLTLSVSDNGGGMSFETLAKLNYKLQNPPKHANSSIGLSNINQRVQLFYGPEYGLTITSVHGEGTIVYLKLPLHFNWEE